MDLASYAYQIWKNTTTRIQTLRRLSPRTYRTSSIRRALLRRANWAQRASYLRTADDNDALAYVNQSGQSITESQFEILRAAECAPSTPAVARSDGRHALVQEGVKHIVREERRVGGQLGRPSGARIPEPMSA